MKKFIAILVCLILPFGALGCKKQSTTAVIWVIQPSSLSAETEIRQTLRTFDASALISFIPASEINSRIEAAAAKGECPNVFMCLSDDLPKFAEASVAADISARLSVSNVKQDELTDGARRACLHQGKTYGVPAFCDVYMLASNRSAVPVLPASPDELMIKTSELPEGVAPFERLAPVKQSLLFESFLTYDGGKMLDARKSKCAFGNETGAKALCECANFVKSAGETDAIGQNKAAFSVMTLAEHKQTIQKYPDAEITLSPLFGLNRLQTVCLCISSDSDNQRRDFEILEFLHSKTDKLASVYQFYSAKKDITPLSPADSDLVKYIAEATPAPDTVQYSSLVKTHIPAAIDKAAKGVDPLTAINEIQFN